MTKSASRLIFLPLILVALFLGALWFADPQAQLARPDILIPGNPSVTVSALGPPAVIGGGYIATGQPTFTFTVRHASNNVSYSVEIDDSPSFDSPVLAFGSGFAASGTKTFIAYQTVEDGEYLVGQWGDVLSDGDYYWRVIGFSADSNSDWVTANSGNVAFRVDKTGPAAGAITSSATTDSVTLSLSEAADAGSGLVSEYTFHETTTGLYAVQSVADYTFTGLTPETSYTFEVGLVDALGNRATSTTITVITESLPITSGSTAAARASRAAASSAPTSLAPLAPVSLEAATLAKIDVPLKLASDLSSTIESIVEDLSELPEQTLPLFHNLLTALHDLMAMLSWPAER